MLRSRWEWGKVPISKNLIISFRRREAPNKKGRRFWIIYFKGLSQNRLIARECFFGIRMKRRSKQNSCWNNSCSVLMIKLNKWIKEERGASKSSLNSSWSCAVKKFCVSVNQISFNIFLFILSLKQSEVLICWKFQEKVLIKTVAANFFL